MKSYMPPSHRELIKYVEDNSKVKQAVADNKELIKLYDDCCQEISIFRSQHLRYAMITFIIKAQKAPILEWWI